MSTALVVLSGGQDSTTCLFKAIEDHDLVHAISFDYGQRHARELEAADKVFETARALHRGKVGTHEVVRLPAGILGGKSFLTDKSAQVETFASPDEMTASNAYKDNKLDASFVPLRNPLFLTIACNRAYVLGAEAIYTGLTAADYAEYGEFTWEWVGGFVDAEGCFSKSNTDSFTMTVYQKDPEMLRRLGAWLQEQAPGLTFGFSVDKTGCAELSIAKTAFALIADKLTPHIHSEHRRQQAARHGVELASPAPLNDAYVAGFWEGDGGCYSAHAKTGQYDTRTFMFNFYQKDAQVLEEIKGYLGAGSVGKDGDGFVLEVSDGPIGAKLLARLRPHFNVLGSFKKVTKYRHKIGLEGGGFNPPYPDCSPDFVFRYQQALDESLRQPGLARIKVVTPLLYLTKAQAVHMAKRLPGCWEALAYTHTAYDGQYPPTGKDHASLLRAKGFEEAGLPDPLVVRAWREGLMDLPDTPNYTTTRTLR